MSKYDKTVWGRHVDTPEVRCPTIVDVYDVLMAFKVACPARQHALKKLLQAGSRGAKGTKQDLQEALESILRAIELEEYK